MWKWFSERLRHRRVERYLASDPRIVRELGYDAAYALIDEFERLGPNEVRYLLEEVGPRVEDAERVV